MDRNLRRNTLILVFSLAATLVIYLAVFLFPQRRNASEMRVGIEQKRSEIERCNQQAHLLATFHSELALLEAVSEQATKEIPTALNVREFLSTVHSLGSQAGITISNVTPGIATEIAGVQQQPVSLALVGQFRPAMQLIHELETMGRLVELTDIDIRAVDKGGASDRLEFKLSVRLFARPPKSANPTQNNG
jgi:Tfp pilus assembly protein PilO